MASWARTLWSDSEAEASASSAARARALPSNRWRPRLQPLPDEGSMPPPARSEEKNTRVSRSRALVQRSGCGPPDTPTLTSQQLAPPGPEQGVFFAGCTLDLSRDRVVCDVLPPRLERSLMCAQGCSQWTVDFEPILRVCLKALNF